MTQLEMHRSFFEHPDGKQYMIALIREVLAGNQVGTTVFVKQWGKSVVPDFALGQMQHFVGPYDDMCSVLNREHAVRASRGYVRQSLPGFDKWAPVASTSIANLNNKLGIDIENVVTGATVQLAGQSGTYVQQPAPAETVETIVVPGPTVQPAKRVDWVIAHSDHPEALSQMMHAAGQMQKLQGELQIKLGKIDSDLAFAQSWMRQRMRATS